MDFVQVVVIIRVLVWKQTESRLLCACGGGRAIYLFYLSGLGAIRILSFLFGSIHEAVI